MYKVVCAWCGKFLGGRPSATNISHGICRPCVEDMMAGADINNDIHQPLHGVPVNQDCLLSMWIDVGGEG